ncbi:hypothetical protein EG68_05339 [Paragonimus skrjabini miyazakii]|uniref:LIM zinc-binding domain-containing protein n=1 Tax=Paragonimus skrjabini miyazakii TaxID=59628 RepID=A0A8S9Z9E8_9TREM|nr:hypothetical protein EG68_05339 [Paragonimus skrjabini miyazakii]
MYNIFNTKNYFTSISLKEKPIRRCCVCDRDIQPSAYLPGNGPPYHLECMSCTTCGKQLQANNANVVNGKTYCLVNCGNQDEPKSHPLSQVVDLTAEVSPPTPYALNFCYTCGYKVYACEELRELGRVYHKHCFKCRSCCRILSVDDYMMVDGEPYCKPRCETVKVKVILDHKTPSDLNYVRTLPSK